LALWLLLVLVIGGLAVGGYVTPDQPVQAVLDAYPDWKIPAAVIAIIPTADRAKATVKVRIAIKAKDPRLLPEMGVRVSFLEELAQAREGAANVGCKKARI
jgi:multidrug efflux pump subunit AcrA (membrane-fusion protein)